MGRPSSAGITLGIDRLVALVDGTLHGDGDAVEIAAVAELGDAEPHDLVFVVDQKRVAQLDGCAAGVVLAPHDLADSARKATGAPVVAVADAYAAVARVLEELHPEPTPEPGVHPLAFVHESAVVDPTASVAAGAAVDAGARIGARTRIGPSCSVGAGVQVGDDGVLHAGVTLYEGTQVGDRAIFHAGVVIGADGFGFARDAQGQLKIPQVGGVRIGDDVEIGANSCVDRGTLRETTIGSGTKIDNLVQIGHNCQIGKNCAFSALTGLSGSTVVEDGVIMGGNVGTAGHQVIGAGSMIAAKGGVHGDLAPGSIVAGAPHMEIGVWRRAVTAYAKLPELLRRVRQLERAAKESEK